MEDLKSMSLEELESLERDLSEKISILNGDQMSIKIAMNSMYGVFANKYFTFFSWNIASAVTGMGRYMTKMTIQALNNYFLKKWPNDKKLHEKMGIKNVKPILNEPCVYGDTDSVFFTLEEIYKNCEGWDKIDDKAFGDTEFMLSMYENRLKSFFEALFSKIQQKFGLKDNFMVLELEKIARSAVFLTKKHYVLDISWMDKGKDGIYFDPLDKMVFTGGPVAKSVTPPYIKDKIKESMKIIFKHKDDFDISVFLNYIMNMKEEFMLKDISEISKSTSMNMYQKYVINDGESVIMNKGVPYSVRAAVYHNHLLNTKHTKLKSKYNLINDNMKVKTYFVENPTDDFDRFAYIPNAFPYEFAPRADKDKQYDDVFLRDLNRYLSAMELPDIHPSLFVKTSLF